MIQAVTTVSAAGAVLPMPDTAREPVMSAGLVYMIETFSRLCNDGAPRPEDAFSRVTVVEQEEAKRLLRYFERAAQPAPRATVYEWMDRVAKACAQPPADKALNLRVDSLMDTAREISVAAWTGETRAEFSASPYGDLFPGDSKVVNFLRPISNSFKAKRRLLERVAEHPIAKDGQKAPPTEEERAAVTEAARQAALILAGNRIPPSRQHDPTAATYVSDRILLAQYTECAKSPGVGQEAAIARRDSLRIKLGVDVETNGKATH